MSQPFVSIVVPAYNVESLLPRCLGSLCAQTMGNVEILLVDDGSADRTGAVCDFWAEKDSRIRVIHQAHRGVSAARNAALECCRGEFIGFADADDLAAPNLYEQLYRAAKESGSDIAMCRYTLTEPLSESADAKILSADEAILLVLDFGEKVKTAVWNKLFRREIVENLRFNEEKFVAEDLDFLVCALLKAKSVAYLPAALYGYHAQRAGSAMYRPGRNREWYVAQCRSVVEAMNRLTEARPHLQTEAVAYICGNPYMAFAAVCQGDDLRRVRKKLRENAPLWLHSRLRATKKLQMLAFLLCPRLYSRFMGRKERNG